MKEGNLQFIANRFEVQPCIGNKKLLKDLTTWELLNLRPETVLNLGEDLNTQYGISGDFLQAALDQFNIQTVGRGVLEEKFGIKKPMQYLLSKTRHYSWPKGMGMNFVLSQS